MSSHVHPHAHSHAHPRAAADEPTVSLLRLSAGQRLLVVGGALVLLWAAVLWVIQSS